MSSKSSAGILLALSLSLFTLPVYSHGKLSAAQLQQYFSDTTQLCRKESDESLCTTYFSADGIIKRRMHEDDARKQGTWEIDEEDDLLCITWDGKVNPLCFEAFLNKDNTIDMYKHDQHISTVLSFSPGNPEGL